MTFKYYLQWLAMNACMVTLAKYHTLKQKRLMWFEGPCRLVDYLVQLAIHKFIRLSRHSTFVYLDILSNRIFISFFSKGCLTTKQKLPTIFRKVMSICSVNSRDALLFLSQLALLLWSSSSKATGLMMSSSKLRLPQTALLGKSIKSSLLEV